MQIGIVGSGNVGGTLGRRFAEAGHSVIFGARRPDSPEAQELARISGGRLAAPREAAQAAEVIVLATPWPATGQAVRGLGDLTGKILLDATNPLNATFDALDPGNTSSGGELVAQWAVGARVVKIFNTIGYNVMADPSFPGGPATLFYCGDDPAAKSVARDLAAEIGFDPVDAGPLSKARALEPLALLWIGLAFGGHGREIAFRLVRR
jgi:predicted dinucleotide-binding enzyme